MSAVTISYPPMTYTSGQLEAAKWIALFAMVVDHVNAVLFDRELGMLATAIGRLAFPLFAIVIGYNLARPGVDLVRVGKRLAIAALVAAPVYVACFGWYPVNVFGLFLVAVAAIGLVKQKRHELAVAAVLLGGLLVEYWWPGVCLVLAVWAYARRPGPWESLGCSLALVGVCIVNGNAWALLALPLLGLVQRVDPDLPRLRWAFYAAYPAHLAILLVLRGV